MQLEYRLTVMVMTDDNDVDVDGKLMVVVLMAMAVMLVWIVVMMVRLTAQLLMNDDASSHVLDIGSPADLQKDSLVWLLAIIARPIWISFG